MQPRRVLHVTPYYAEAWAYGGIPRVSATLARAQAQRGHEVTVCATDACDQRSRTKGGDADDGVQVRLFFNLSNRLAYHWQLFMPLGLGRWLREHARDFDVAHLHACHHLPGAIAAGHLRGAGVPYVLQPHGTAPLIERRWLAKRIFDVTLGRGVLSGAALVIAVSDAERRQLLSLGLSASKIEIVPNPIDLSEFEPPIQRGQFRRRLRLGTHRVVLFLGKLTPRKRVDVLVEAMAMLPQKDAILVIAGNDLGAERTIRRLVARRHLQARTIFTGLLCGRERLEALADADVVVYPSRDEVFGLVPLEALCCGTPVVVADDSGCGEVVDGTGGGQVVPQGDPAAVAGAIVDVLDRPGHWREAALKARQRVHELYAPQPIAARMAKVYEGVIAADIPVVT